MALADGFRVQYEGMGVVNDADNQYAVAVEMLIPPTAEVLITSSSGRSLRNCEENDTKTHFKLTNPLYYYLHIAPRRGAWKRCGVQGVCISGPPQRGRKQAPGHFLQALIAFVYGGCSHNVTRVGERGGSPVIARSTRSRGAPPKPHLPLSHRKKATSLPKHRPAHHSRWSGRKKGSARRSKLRWTLLPVLLLL
jgi:hypothetical protein